MKKIISIILLLPIVFCGTVEAKRSPAEKRARKEQRKENWRKFGQAFGNAVGSVAVGLTASAYENRTGDVQTANQMRQLGVELGADANIVNYSGSFVGSQNKNEKVLAATSIASAIYDKGSGEFSEVAGLNAELSRFDLEYLQKMNRATSKEEKAAFKKEWLEGRNELTKQIGDTRKELKAEKDADCAAEMLDARSEKERADIFKRCPNCTPCYIAEIESRKLQAKEEREDDDFYGDKDDESSMSDESISDEGHSVKNGKVSNNSTPNSQNQIQQTEQKTAEERKNAIQKIKTAKIDDYAFDETALSQSQKSALDAIADVLNQYSDIKVLIIGHTCEIGYKNINQKKGLKRAEAGKDYLTEKGIASHRISVDSKGEEQPLVPNTSSENRRQNRRIEFAIE